MTHAYLQPPHSYDNLLSTIIWLSIHREGSRSWSYYLCSMTTQMVSQTDRLMGDTCAIYYGEADNDTIAQVVKCTPVIVLHHADEITLFACPCSTGKMTCFVFLTSPPPPLPMMLYTTSGLRWSHKACLHDYEL